MAPTAPKASEGSRCGAAPTIPWKPTSFWRVLRLPTTDTAEEEGGAELRSAGRAGAPVPTWSDLAPASEATLTSSLLSFSCFLAASASTALIMRSEEHTSELQSLRH